MDRPASSTAQLMHLAWPVLVAQLAMMANAVIDTAMAGRLSAIDLASVGIAASIMATVLMTLISVLLALPPIIAQLYGAGRRAEVGREIHQSVWISLVLALVAMLLLRFPGPIIAISHLQPLRRNQGARLSHRIRLGRARHLRVAHLLRLVDRHRPPAPGDVFQPAVAGESRSR